MAKAAVFVLPVRVHDGCCFWQICTGQMVIQNDNIGPDGRRNRPRRQRSAIYANDQAVVLCQRRHCRVIWAVTLINSVGDI